MLNYKVRMMTLLLYKFNISARLPAKLINFHRFSAKILAKITLGMFLDRFRIKL